MHPLVDDAVAIAVSAAVAVVCALLLVQSVGWTRLHWFGGWTPRGSTVVGVVFAVDPIEFVIANASDPSSGARARTS